jgi:hypothetical protein
MAPSGIARASTCQISAIDVDGGGRRLEAAFGCIGSARALGAQYVWVPLFSIQHNMDVSAFNAWWGLAKAFPTVEVHAAKSTSSEPTIFIHRLLPRLAVASAHYKLAKRAAVFEQMMTSHDPPHLCSGVDGARTANLLNNKSWLHGLERGERTCQPETVYLNQDCAVYFWCEVVARRGGIEWYRVVPLLQHAYAFARADPRPRQPDAAANVRADPIIIGVHVRTVKRRTGAMLTGAAYWDLIHALRERHMRYVHRLTSGAGAPQQARPLRIVVHCDSGGAALIHRPPACPAPLCDIAIVLSALQNVSGVELRLPGREASRADGQAMQGAPDTLLAMHDLAVSDALVLSASSFSITMSMLGNMTTFVPTCGTRALPHWVRVPCGHGLGKGTEGADFILHRGLQHASPARQKLRDDIVALAQDMDWPPPRNRVQSLIDAARAPKATGT